MQGMSFVRRAVKLRRCDALLSLLAVGFLNFAGTRAAAQGLTLSPITGSLDLTADVSRQETDSRTGDSRFDRDRFEQKLNLATRGSLLSPRIMTFRLGGEIGFRQELFDSSVAKTGDATATFWGHDVLVDLFAPRRISLLFFSNRHEDSRIQDFGTDTDVLSDVLGGTLNLRVPYFPLSFTARRSRLRTESKGGGFFNRRDETRRLLELAGSHRSRRTTASLRLREVDVDDNSIPSVQDFRIREGNLAFGHRWGSQLNKSVRINARHFVRTQNIDFRSTTANSVLAWDVTDNLLGQAEYQFTRFDNVGQDTTTHRGITLLSHQLYDSLWTKLRFLGEFTTVDSGERSLYGPEGSLRYRKQLPWSSVLRIDGRALYRIEDRKLDDPRVQTPAERLQITGPVDNFLANRNVVTSSIRVFDSNGSEFTEGVDYTVDVVGDRTAINPVLGGGVSSGDTVLVNYAFLTDPDVKFERSTLHAGAGWDFGWAALRFDHNQTNERVLEGDSRAGQDTQRDALRFDLRRRDRKSLVSGSLFLIRDETSIVKYDEVAATQALSWRFMKGFEWNADGRQSWRDFENPDRTTRILSAATSVAWRHRRGHKARVFFRFRDLSDSTSLDQRNIEIGIRGLIQLGRLQVEPRMRWIQNERDSTQSTDFRFFVALRRRF